MNIHKTYNGKYLIEKTVYGNKINYGIYETIYDAKKQVKILEDNDWIKSKKTGYDKKESFKKYKIIHNMEDKYTIVNFENTIEYGTYNNKKYAEIIVKILPFYEDKINLKIVQDYACKEFYKYITPEKTGRYRIRMNNINTSRCRTIRDALVERDLLLKCKDLSEDDDLDELLCNIDTVDNSEYEGKLPIPPWKKEQTNISMKNKGYYLVKVKDKKIILGSFKTEFVTRCVLDYLNNHNWDKKSVKNIQNTILNLYKPDRNIIKYNGKYEIVHTSNKKRQVYYKTSDLIKARYIRNKLEEKSWNKSIIKEYEKIYEKNLSSKI
ncbi:MAG: hypothetical protein E7Z84_04870 [Methanosphaera stadtmanae]|nr:hypothetical protein [Methanosphaera stadtmanae]